MRLPARSGVDLWSPDAHSTLWLVMILASGTTCALTVSVKGVSSEPIQPKDFPYGGEWFLPSVTEGSRPSCRLGRLMLYLHGGAFVTCSSKSHRHLLSHIAANTYISIMAINYRRPPEHPWPTPVDDALLAYERLLERASAHHIVLAGDSAGGGLCLTLMLRLKERGLPLPNAAVLLSPWVDLTDVGVCRRPFHSP